MLRTLLLSGLLALFCCVDMHMYAQQGPSTSMSYESHNQVDPKPLKVHSINGVARDDEGNVVPSVMVGIFTEKDHKLIETTETSNKGEFVFKYGSPGRYRVVAKHPAFCTANVPVIISGNGAGHPHRILELHMKVGGIDTCSFGSLR